MQYSQIIVFALGLQTLLGEHSAVIFVIPIIAHVAVNFHFFLCVSAWSLFKITCIPDIFELCQVKDSAI